MPFINKPVSQVFHHLPRRRMLTIGIASTGMLLSTAPTFAQAIEARQWQGATAMTRQPEHVVASTIAEWRSLWSRVGSPPPDMFEAGRMNAVGIFLGRRASEGYAVNVLSTARRRDRIVVVFEERMPMEQMMAQRAAPRPVSSAPSAAPSTLPSGAAGFAAPGAAASLPPPPVRPASHPTSPWAIVLINRSDLPVSVEQRLFR
ncbi:MAG: hypothetical protein EPO50_05730 [Reyranella sp.]|nr:MAG: hypothetical protein EPO50_05730 [Reyranella sp.]